MKLMYVYNNDIIKYHTTFINKKNIIKECKNATQVAIYKNKEVKKEYITTLLIK